MCGGGLGNRRVGAQGQDPAHQVLRKAPPESQYERRVQTGSQSENAARRAMRKASQIWSNRLRCRLSQPPVELRRQSDRGSTTIGEFECLGGTRSSRQRIAACGLGGKPEDPQMGLPIFGQGTRIHTIFNGWPASTGLPDSKDPKAVTLSAHVPQPNPSKKLPSLPLR